MKNIGKPYRNTKIHMQNEENIMQNQAFHYRKALPVWESGASNEKNVTLSFSASVDGSAHSAVLYASAACSFTIFVNGDLVAHGPARTAHEFFRTDVIDLTPHLHGGQNLVTARVTGYNVDSFAYLDQRPFFCAEILADGEITAATGVVGFTAHRMTERLQRVQRYSFQRPFIEVYRLAPGAFAYEIDSSAAPEAVLELVGSRNFLTRSAPNGDYAVLYPKSVSGGGAVAYSEKEKYHGDRSITRVTEGDDQFEYDFDEATQGSAREKKFHIKGFLIENLEIRTFEEVGKMDFIVENPPCTDASVIPIGANRYADIDMGANETGLFAFDLDVREESAVYLLFDEVLRDGLLDPFRIGSASNILAFLAKPGTYRIVTAEPYVGRYIRLVAKGGAVTVKNFRMIEIAFPMSKITARLTVDDANLQTIYDAALRTFRANVVDVYMDCPSRERAGWLCDSFFTSRVEKVLSGRSDVELDFLEAFVLRDTFPTIPDKMLPMCYPSDHHSGNFIPNWAMWYVLELREYFDRTGDRVFIDRARHTAERLYEWFIPYENEYGLLEKLPGWIFVEWSKANQLVQDVSFATNMLYASFLDAIAKLYGRPREAEKAAKLRETIRQMSMYNGYFCDNAVRDEGGKLVLSGECTEGCQYYAFFCDVATPKTYPDLWNTLVADFGFDRRTTMMHPEIHFANAFIGNYLRLDLLCRYGYTEMLESNIRDYFTYMAESTGTLWEYEDNKKSCNHGFASHVIYWLDKLGYIGRV